MFTKTNPVRERRKYSPTLEIENFGLEQSDLDTVFQAGNDVGIGAATLREIIAHLEETYCESIGIEFVYMRDPERISWLRNKIELKNSFSSKNVLLDLVACCQCSKVKCQIVFSLNNLMHTCYTNRKVAYFVLKNYYFF